MSSGKTLPTASLSFAIILKDRAMQNTILRGLQVTTYQFRSLTTSFLLGRRPATQFPRTPLAASKMSGRGGGRGGNANGNNRGQKGGGRGRGGRGGRGRGGRGGKGRGSNSASNNRRGDGATQQGTNRPAKKNLDPSQFKKNGEKGAEVHTVSESDRIRLTKTLMAFREDPEESRLELPPTLTNTERKFLHQLAGQLGLTSKSTGKGENRRIVVTKRGETTKSLYGDGNEPSVRYPLLDVGKKGAQAIRQHLVNFPPSHEESLESHDTGSSLMEAIVQAQQPTSTTSDQAIADTLDRLGLGSSQEAAPSKFRKQYINLDQRRASHQAFQEAKLASPNYSKRLAQRQKLPAFAKQQQIVDTVAQNPVTIIQGETGCGKSTQCPQFVLDANPTAKIVVTQPRRISAISIADRVAHEQCLTTQEGSRNRGGKGAARDGVGSLVGYQVRLEAAATKDTQLLFVTPGILLRKLQGSPRLEEFTHIVIDEVHERDRYTDFLLIALRDLLPQRPDLRLVLMSATLQTDLLINYFSGSNMDNTNSMSREFYARHPPAILEIEGRTFPVQEFFLEDVLQVTEYIDPAVAAAAFAGDGGDTYGGGAMSMDELDAALATLMGGGGKSASKTSGSKRRGQVQPAVVCPMCGQNFANSIELGAHVAVCQGANTTSIYDEDAGDKVELLTPDLLGAGTAHNFEAFDTYDVGESAEIQGYDFHVASAVSQQAVFEEEGDEASKWDGTGQFLVKNVGNEDAVSSITPEQDALLNHYQMMHDDEQIDTDLLLDTLQYIHKSSQGDGAILVFLPGWQEISEVMLLLDSTYPFSDRSRFLVLPLHSGIPSSDQRRVLQRPPSGTRKIVLSTNIAETSLTIDDVSFVVDSGRAKEKDYDPHLKTSTLQPTWISQAASKQRKGRAGRTKAGVCFHLFSSRRHQSMRPFVESELLRTPLEEMCLFTKKLGLAPGGPEDPDGVPAFLAKAMTPPHEKSISNALELLVDLGAMIPETNDLTHLGQCLSILSLEPRVGKMVIWSYLLGCSNEVAQMAVSMSYKSPFVLPPQNMRKEAVQAQIKLSRGSESDQVTVYNAILQYDKLKRKSEGSWRDFCRKNYLSAATVQTIAELRRNITRELTSLQFFDPMNSNGKSFHNRHQNEEALWQAALAAGLYPNVATRKQGDANFSTMTNRKCKIHISSVNAAKGQPLNAKCQVAKDQVEFVCYGEMVKGAHFFTISQTTHLASALPLQLLSGTLLTVRPDPGDTNFAILELDDWIVFKCHRDVASGIVILRKRLDKAFLNVLADPASLGSDRMPAIDKDAVEVIGLVLQSALTASSVR